MILMSDGGMMSLNERILNKSNSYNFYKSEYEKLLKKQKKSDKQVKKYKAEISKLKDENKSYANKISDLEKDIIFLRRELKKTMVFDDSEN